MPHCCIEYTPNVLAKMDKAELLHTAHQVMLSAGLFGAADVKTRAHEVSDFILGEQPLQQSGFIHIIIYLLSGRTAEQKQALTHSMAQALLAKLPDLASITVDIRDMTRETYAKDVM